MTIGVRTVLQVGPVVGVVRSGSLLVEGRLDPPNRNWDRILVGHLLDIPGLPDTPEVLLGLVRVAHERLQGSTADFH